MGLRNAYNNYFFGRPDQPDFGEKDMPKNRFELFQDALDANKGALTGLSLLYAICWLPSICWAFLNTVQLQSLLEQGALNMQSFSSVLFTFLLLLFPMIAITGPFNMGATFVIRNLARDEHSFVLSDFWGAVRANWKQGLLLSTLNGLMPLALYVWLLLANSMPLPAGFSYAIVGVVLVVLMIWSLVVQLMPMMIVTYRQGFFALLANAALMTIATLPRALGIKLLTLAVPLLVALCVALFPGALTWIIPIALALYVFFLLSFNKLITVSYANAVCEKYLNSKIEGAKTNIGLHIKE